jgi:hypothetical protein
VKSPDFNSYFLFARHAGTGIRIQPENGALDFGRWNILLA